jgi:hypothetical protein
VGGVTSGRSIGEKILVILKTPADSVLRAAVLDGRVLDLKQRCSDAPELLVQPIIPLKALAISA